MEAIPARWRLPAFALGAYAQAPKSETKGEPKAKADKVLFPKLFQGVYGAEISTLLTSKSQALHSSFWDGDQESFIIQSGARGLAKRMPYVGTTVESAIWRLRDNLTPYDASYIALAEALGATLVTTDARMARAPGHTARVELLS